MKYFIISMFFMSSICLADPNELAALKKEVARLTGIVKSQDTEIQRLMELCLKNGINPHKPKITTPSETQIKSESPDEIEIPKKNNTPLVRRKEQIDDMLKKGFIYSVDIKHNQVRMSPSLFRPLPLEEKQGLVMLFSKYFEESGSTVLVTILSNRNDAILAEYSVRYGVKIYY